MKTRYWIYLLIIATTPYMRYSAVKERGCSNWGGELFIPFVPFIIEMFIRGMNKK